jgi:hypothetical protein
MIRRSEGDSSKSAKAAAAKITDLRKVTKNHLHLKCVLLRDRELQKLSRMLLVVSDVFNSELVRSIEAQKTTHGSLIYAANRSNGDGLVYDGLVEILVDPHLLRNFGFTLDSVELFEGIDKDDGFWDSETDLANDLFTLVFQGLSVHGWSMSFHEVLFPHCFATAFCEEDTAREALARIKERSQALTFATNLAANGNPTVERVLADVEGYDTQLTLELQHICDVFGWVPGNTHLK